MGADHAAALERRVGGHVDDAPLAPIAQQRPDRADPEKRASEVDRKHVVPFLGLDGEEILHDRPRGTVDEPPGLAGRRQAAGGGIPVGRFADVQLDVAPREVRADDREPVRAQACGHRRPEPAGRPRHEDGPHRARRLAPIAPPRSPSSART